MTTMSVLSGRGFGSLTVETTDCCVPRGIWMEIIRLRVSSAVNTLISDRASMCQSEDLADETWVAHGGCVSPVVRTVVHASFCYYNPNLDAGYTIARLCCRKILAFRLRVVALKRGRRARGGDGSSRRSRTAMVAVLPTEPGVIPTTRGRCHTRASRC